MDNIIQNGFDHPKFDVNASILVLMLHKFGANALNLVLIHKKTGSGGYYNFFFFLIMFYVKLGERQKNLRGEPLAFSYFKISISN
jgi:hypothetical protein